MSNPPPGIAVRWLRGLVTRRNRRRSWAYVIWLLAYLPLLVWMVDFLSGGVRLYPLLAGLITLVIVGVHLVHPTLIGWAVIAIPSIGVAGLSVYYVVVTAADRVRDDLPGLVVSLGVVAVYVLVCVALWFARPNFPRGLAAQPGALVNGAAAPPAGDSGAAGDRPSAR